MFTTVSNIITRLPNWDDAAAWQLFERRYSPVLKSYFRKSYCNESLALELAQETLHHIAQGLKAESFHKDRGRLRDWISGIAHNVLRTHYRSMAAKSPPSQLRSSMWKNRRDPAAEADFEIADQQFDAIWVRTRLSQLLRAATQNFSHRDLRCYFLVEVRKVPIKEVARRLNISESAVYKKRRQVANWLLAVGPRFISRWER